ncbi:sigma intracellular receptor 2 [Ricinus communis]|uniref:EXPERA domain-containing protein n=1 Tax=Ricinus communis TaxID=3988 RepID=B9SDV4_RICCO|nr:sigma intracellular receptor 2 [Ricinus communis]EEF38188.1 conserved hypothetical protein [Ricinus communis]|eukprot:XP_002524173.1 sigma intracellular receptor 2 [Ricinus communis]
MGACMKLIDTILFFLFLVLAVAAPLMDAQAILPLKLYPDFLINFNNWYVKEHGDYLVAEKTPFFVGIIWLELLFLWPLALLNMYGIIAAKPWFNTTCLIYGTSIFTSMVAIVAELIGSGRASDKLMMIHAPCLGIGLLAILRGLVPHSGNTASAMGKRKRA